MTGGWAATNTFRANATHRGPFFNWETGLVPPHDDDCPGCKQDAALALVEAALDANLKALDAYYQFTPHMLGCGVLGGHCDCGRDELDALYKDAAVALRAVREGK